MLGVQDKLTFPDWIGEFGWELMSWQAKCRFIAKEMGLPNDRVLVKSFDGMGPLYEDFATFTSHGLPKRAIGWKPKQYRIKGLWKKFGNPTALTKRYKYLYHARMDPHKAAKNCKAELWDSLVLHLGTKPEECASIGTKADYHIPGTVDERDIGLQNLMDLMANCTKVVGQSSGPMHLAALCNASLVVWADNRTYFSETLEKRYKETWNPHKVHVDYVYTGLDWQPKLQDVLTFL
jgi:hypothetical protein